MNASHAQRIKVVQSLERVYSFIVEGVDDDDDDVEYRVFWMAYQTEEHEIW